jgi:hypothetical protein
MRADRCIKAGRPRGTGTGREYPPERGGGGRYRGAEDGPLQACSTALTTGGKMKSHKADLLYSHPCCPRKEVPLRNGDRATAPYDKLRWNQTAPHNWTLEKYCMPYIWCVIPFGGHPSQSIFSPNGTYLKLSQCLA